MPADVVGMIWRSAAGSALSAVVRCARMLDCALSSGDAARGRRRGRERVAQRADAVGRVRDAVVDAAKLLALARGAAAGGERHTATAAQARGRVGDLARSQDGAHRGILRELALHAGERGEPRLRGHRAAAGHGDDLEGLGPAGAHGRRDSVVLGA
jgi:hypothetical protein